MTRWAQNETTSLSFMLGNTYRLEFSTKLLVWAQIKRIHGLGRSDRGGDSGEDPAAFSVSKKRRGTRRSGPGKPGRPQGGESPGEAEPAPCGPTRRSLLGCAEQWQEVEAWLLRAEEWTQPLTDFLLWRNLGCRKGLERREVAARRERGGTESSPHSTRQDLRIFLGLSDKAARRYWSLRQVGE